MNGDPSVVDPDDIYPVDAIEQLVEQFYGRIREDDLLGPIFDEHIDSWEPHLDRMVLFWRAVLRGERTFKPTTKGSPPVLHARMKEIRAVHFERWLSLFGDTARHVFPDDRAEHVLDCATRIATAFARYMSVH